MPSLRLADVQRALPVAKKLVQAIDVDKDGEVDSDEVNRIQVRDNFVAKNLVRLTIRDATYPDSPARPTALKGQLDAAFRSLQRADKNGDGLVTDAELKKASQVARALATFAQVHQGKTLSDFKVKPFEKPGTAAWNSVAKRDYYNVDRNGGGQPRFGTALILSRAQLPAALRPAYDAMRRDFPTGTLEASSWLVNGAPAYFMHVKQPTRVDVRIFTAKGVGVAEGVFTGGATDWSTPWRSRWVNP